MQMRPWRYFSVEPASGDRWSVVETDRLGKPIKIISTRATHVQAWRRRAQLARREYEAQFHSIRDAP